MQQVLENPTQVPRVLDRRNYDGVRWQCTKAIQAALARDPALFQRPGMEAVVESLKDVASERLPFSDSPSLVAQQILDRLARS